MKKAIISLLILSTLGIGVLSGENKRKVAFLGITVKETDRGTLIEKVQEKSPADRAGLLPGDVLTGWNEHRIENASDFLLNLYTQRPGDRITVTLRRENLKKKIKVTLTEKKDRYAELYNEIPLIINLFRLEILGYALDEIGIMVGNLPSTLNEYFEVPDGGVLVQIVEPDSEGARKGIKPGDVIYAINGKPTPYTVQFRKIMDEESEYEIKLKRKGRDMTVSLKRMESPQ
ncbi:MAG TPA: PDZ domain-containing protein [Firmicutes bacterium]|nr:PDZ domain-containing protein [Bacillota bacterium]